MDQTANPDVLLETVALGAHEDWQPAGLGREPEDGKFSMALAAIGAPDERPSSGRTLACERHMARTPALQQALSNAWLKVQGLVSVKDLWCKAQGYPT